MIKKLSISSVLNKSITLSKLRFFSTKHFCKSKQLTVAALLKKKKQPTKRNNPPHPSKTQQKEHTIKKHYKLSSFSLMPSKKSKRIWNYIKTQKCFGEMGHWKTMQCVSTVPYKILLHKKHNRTSIQPNLPKFK